MASDTASRFVKRIRWRGNWPMRGQSPLASLSRGSHGRCHNRLCVNPDHLTLGTQAENLNDKYDDMSNIRPEVPLSAAEGEFVRAWVDDLGRTVASAQHALGGIHLATVKKGLRQGREARDWSLAVWSVAFLAFVPSLSASAALPC